MSAVGVALSEVSVRPVGGYCDWIGSLKDLSERGKSQIFSTKLAHLIFGSVGLLLAGVSQANNPMEPEFVPSPARFPVARSGAQVSASLARDSAIRIELPEVAEIRAKKGAPRTGPTEIGFGRELPPAYQKNLIPLLTWDLQGDGSYAAVIEVTSPDAKGMRAGIRVLASKGVELRFFDPNDPTATFPAYHPKSKNGRWDDVAVHWSPTVSGDRLGIAIYAPNWDAVTNIRLEIERISHLFLDPRKPLLPRSSTESNILRNTCESIPVACGRSSACTRNATALLIFVRPSGHSYVCTGTLINDDREDQEKANNAYMHTAHHCIDSQGVAESLEAEFHYAYESCNGTLLDSRYGRQFGGADLVEAAPAYDQSLIRLRYPLAVEGLCLSGWDPNRKPINTAVLGVHHPGGRPKESVTGRIRGYERTTFKEIGGVDAGRVEYQDGHTQGGSSGSGLFLDNGNDVHYLLGSLVGGPEEGCGVGYYGSLSDFFPHIRPYLRDETPPPSVDDHGNSRAEATGTAVNTTVDGQLESPDDIDYFTFTIDGDGSVTIKSLGLTDTIGKLYDSEGRELQTDDDGGAAYNFYLSMELSAGTYYISVVGYDGEVGDYQLSVEYEADPVWSRAIPLMLPADEEGRGGFLRIQNYSDDAEIALQITGIDDWGERYGPISYPLKPLQSIHFNSTDIEEGNPSKGLDAGLGDGRAWWRLQLKSSTPIYATSYVRTKDGFLTSIHDTAIDFEQDGARYFLVPIFNPASNVNQQSLLRVTNLSKRTNNFAITGIDDAGVAGQEPVQFSVRASQSVYLNAEELENGIPDIESGRFGDGKGKWQLIVAAQDPARVISLLVTPQGHITNLSTINLAIPSAEDLDGRGTLRMDMLRKFPRKNGLAPGTEHPLIPVEFSNPRR